MSTIRRIEQAAGVQFSQEQVNVIQAYGKPTSVNACAGSGKTTTLIGKLLYNELEFGVKPYEMLVISFTNKAVRDIEGRYQQLRRKMGLPAYTPTFSTFHAFFKKMLTVYPDLAGMKLLTGTEYNYTLVKQVTDIGASLNTKTETVSSILNYRGYLINKGYSNDGLRGAEQHYNPMDRNFSLKDYVKVITEYNRIKKENNELDFDDLQGEILKRIKDDNQKGVILDEFKSTYTTVMIDEYQDISPIQYDIMREFLNVIGDRHFVAIGDDDQSIYRFRGSEPKIIIDFEFKHLNAQRLYLSTNYRCPQNILSFVAPSIVKNKTRIAKTLQVASEGGNVNYIDTQYGYQEFVNRVTEDFTRTVRKTDLAILVRDNALRMVIADLLMRRGVPVDIQNMNWSVYHSSVFNRLTDIVKTVKQAKNQKFVEHSWIYAPHIKKENLKQYEYSSQMWVDEVLNGRLKLGGGRDEVVKRMLKTQDAVELLTLAYSLVEQQYINGSKKGFYNIDTVRETYSYILDIAQGKTYHEFKDDCDRIKVQLSSNIGRQKVVNIYTMHGVKGLEFKNVYIYNPIDRYLLRAKHKGHDLDIATEEEERRLFYVAITRAKKSVTLVYDSRESAQFVQECLDNQGTLVDIVEQAEVPAQDTHVKKTTDKPKALSLDLDITGLSKPTISKTTKHTSDLTEQRLSKWDELVKQVNNKTEQTTNTSNKKMSLSDLDKLI